MLWSLIHLFSLVVDLLCYSTVVTIDTYTLLMRFMSFSRPRSTTPVPCAVRVWTEWTTACPRRPSPQTLPPSDPSTRRGRPSEPLGLGRMLRILHLGFSRDTVIGHNVIGLPLFTFSLKYYHRSTLCCSQNEHLYTLRDIQGVITRRSVLFFSSWKPPTPSLLSMWRKSDAEVVWWQDVVDLYCPCCTGVHRLANTDDSGAQTPGTKHR